MAHDTLVASQTNTFNVRPVVVQLSSEILLLFFSVLSFLPTAFVFMFVLTFGLLGIVLKTELRKVFRFALVRASP